MTSPARLDLTVDVACLTEALLNIESVSRNEGTIVDAIEAELEALEHLEVQRLGNSLVARTNLGHGDRVVIAGHVDTVPLNDNLPARNDGAAIHGLGACDMKGGVAVALRLAATLPEPARDVTYVFYDCEEIDAAENGLRKIVERQPDLLEADFAILMEPSDAQVEAGCQGTLRVAVVSRGERAHSARSWRGRNAIHLAAPILQRLNAYQARLPIIDGLEYHEGLNAVLIDGGVATNVIPDLCRVTVNFRYAPDRSEEDALAYVREFFDGFEIEVLDSAAGALPGLDRPAAQAFLQAVGGDAHPKFGWTDVARFTALDIPAVNYGPGDPMLAHKQEEFVTIEQLRRCEDTLVRWLSAPSAEDVG